MKFTIPRYLTAFLILAFVLFPFSLQADFDPQNPGSTIKVAAFEHAPFFYRLPSGAVVGFGPDLFEEIFIEQGFNYSLRYYESFQDALNSVVGGENDVIIGVLRTEQRERFLDYIEAPLTSSWGQVYTAEGIRCDSMAQLEGKSVGMLRTGQYGRNFIDAMANLGVPFEARFYENFTDLEAAVAAGEIDAGVFYNYYFLSTRSLVPSTVVFSPAEVYIAGAKGRVTSVLNFIDDWFARQKTSRSSVYGSLYRQWFSQPLEDSEPDNYYWVGIIALAALIAIWFTSYLFQQNGTSIPGFSGLRQGGAMTLDGMVDGVVQFSVDAPGKYSFLAANTQAEVLLSVKNREATGEDIARVIQINGRTDSFSRLIEKSLDGVVKSRIKAEQGKSLPVELRSTLIIPGNQGITIFRSTETDEQAALRYRTIADHIFSWEFWTDLEHNFIYVSPAALRVTGYPPVRFYSDKNFINSIIHPDDMGSWIHHRDTRHSAYPGSNDEVSTDFRIFTRDGQVRWITHTCITVFDDDNTAVGYRGSNHDITDRVIAEQQLRKSLDERKILMREMNHRIKNNFQMVSGMLNLRADALQDSDGAYALRDMAQRVSAMTEIHRQLYKTGDSRDIDMHEYIAGLFEQIANSFPDSTICLELNVAVHVVEIDMDRAISLGIILNEAIINSFKYAQNSARERFEISVTLFERDSELVLVVADNGPGFPEDVIDGRVRGLGMELIRSQTAQLGGSVEFSNVPGARIELHFRP